ncbi:MAG: hypothetical protein R3E13_07940 [Alphaproteobacteria bacterium]
MKALYIFACALAFILFYPKTSAADCVVMPDNKINLTALSCKNISPENEERLKEYSDTFHDKDFMNRFYTGALVKLESGTEFVYPTQIENPCQEFPLDQDVTKMASYVCCDTGPWGKCILGGNFLYDIGATPVNTFQ